MLCDIEQMISIQSQVLFKELGNNKYVIEEEELYVEVRYPAAIASPVLPVSPPPRTIPL